MEPFWYPCPTLRKAGPPRVMPGSPLTVFSTVSALESSRSLGYTGFSCPFHLPISCSHPKTFPQHLKLMGQATKNSQAPLNPPSAGQDQA